MSFPVEMRKTASRLGKPGKRRKEEDVLLGLTPEVGEKGQVWHGLSGVERGFSVMPALSGGLGDNQ